MSTKQPDPTPPKAGGLWARLFGVSSTAAEPPPQNPGTAPPEAQDQDLSTWPPGRPLTPPQTDLDAKVETMMDVQVDHDDAALSEQAEDAPASIEQPSQSATSAVEEPQPAPVKAGPPEPCPACGTVRKGNQAYCEDCGWMFSNTPVRAAGANSVAAVSTPNILAAQSPGNGSVVPTQSNSTSPMVPGMRLKDRFEIVRPISEREGVARFAGRDHAATPPRPVVIVQAAVPEIQAVVLPSDDDTIGELTHEEELMPSFDDTLPVARPAPEGTTPWPSIAWEQSLLTRLNHPGLPNYVDSFLDGVNEYLIVEQPEGQVLWDAWDDPTVDATARYGWLKEVAQTLHAMHRAGAVCESLRPDIITITKDGHAIFNDLGEFLPLPVSPGINLRASLYTAPELVLTPEQADGRADLYGFGAMLYALEYLHHGLEEKDFERQFSPKLITDRYPDVHPGFFRLISKTFNRDTHSRFPTDEAQKEEKSGFVELMRTLEVCRNTFDSVRLDIAAWTTTGMVRTGNEDAFSLLHGMESRQDELTEVAMVLLCDGMGGYDAGEVAAAMCLQSMRKFLLQEPIFAALTGQESPPGTIFTIEGAKKTLLAALKNANKEIHTAARTPGKGKRGMGCTAECVYIDNRQVVVGHVGDSRTYHLHEGRLIQLTRDQTLVNRLVELGQLTPEEAENHPRKNELQQAIGGQPDVDPGLYHGFLKRGDWVLVCSDGLTNHIPAVDLTMMLSREAMSAEDAARRLMNLINLRGATDNATIVVIRVS